MISRDLLLVALSLMVWGVGEGMFLLFQPLYLQQLGADPVLIGSILGLTGAAMTAVHLPAGYLSDRFGRKPLMLSAWFIGALAAWVMALAQTLPVFVAGSILYAITAFVTVPMNSYITSARNHLSVGRALTLVSAIYNFGAILGPLLGGWIGNHFGLRFNFLLGACIFILSSILITFIHPQPIEQVPSTRISFHLKEVLSPQFVSFLVVTFLVMFVLFLPQPLTVNFLQDERGMDLSQIGLLISIRSLGIVVLNLTLGHADPKKGFFLSQLSVGLFSLLIWKGSGFAWYAVGYLLLGGFQTARSLVTAQGRNIVQTAYMGVSYGIIETVLSLSTILAPPLAGFLYLKNPEVIYIVCLVGIGSMLIISKSFLPNRLGGEYANNP